MANQNTEADPFADYMWMGEMDKFDREMEAQIEEEFEEEEFIKSCIDQLLDEEEERETVYFQRRNSRDSRKSEGHNTQRDHHQRDGHKYSHMNGQDPNHLTQNMNNMYISQQHHHQLPSYQNGEAMSHGQQQQQQQQSWSYTGQTNPMSYRQISNNNNTTTQQQHQKMQDEHRLKRGMEVGKMSMNEGSSQTSSLNPNAAPFVMNPNAKVFVPQGQHN